MAKDVTPRRIKLTGGRTIEILAFESGSARAGDTRDAVGEPRPLHLCPACPGHLVYPVDWEHRSSDACAVTLRCPSCERIETGVFAHDVLDAFDMELDRGTQALVEDLEQLARANMADDVDRFIAALAADAIVPMDF